LQDPLHINGKELDVELVLATAGNLKLRALWSRFGLGKKQDPSSKTTREIKGLEAWLKK
jgi:hypothetical protein